MSSSDSEDVLRAAAKQAKKEKKEKKRKREEEQAAAERASQSNDADADAVEASIQLENERNSDKRHKKEKKEKKEKKAEKRDQQSSDDEEAEKPKAKSGATDYLKQLASARLEADRREEVLAAGARALAEEAAELEEEERARKQAKKEKKKAKKEAEAAAANSTEAVDMEVEETEEERAERKRKKKEKKEKERAAAAASAEASTAAASAAPATSSSSKPSVALAGSNFTASGKPKKEPPPGGWPEPPPGNGTLLLFYQYVRPSWSAAQRQNAENFTRDSLTRHGCTGRLRCAREGFNATLTGPKEGIRAFTKDLAAYEPEHFGNTDFKFVDGLRENQMLKGLKVWHVEELVTYGFGAGGVAPIEHGGTHLTPQEWHDRAMEDNTVIIDVRNANENAIGRFQPLNDPHRVLDPYMRTSTEFPDWVDANMAKLKAAKNVLMYCTAGIRCERASALLVQKGLPTEKVLQLQGGIHRYLEAFPDGGHWVGKNYVFDRRFAHGAVTKTPDVVGRCACCNLPWERYQAGKKCFICRMEVLVCRECERTGKFKTVKLKCHLCGGPKPSYLPADEVVNVPPVKKKKLHGGMKVENDY